MHELGAVRKVIDEINSMDPKPKKIRITIGKMMGTAKGFESMFREHTYETPLQGIEMEIISKDVNVKCPECGFEGMVKIMEHVHFVRCPLCTKITDIVTGNELAVERI